MAVSLPVWPSALPRQPLLDALEESFPSLISNVTTGNKSMIVRKMASRSQTKLSVSFNFTKEQMQTFEDFFNQTLDGGSVRFTFKHPRKKQNVTVSFSPTQNVAFTSVPNGSMNYFKVQAEFIIWN